MSQMQLNTIKISKYEIIEDLLYFVRDDSYCYKLHGISQLFHKLFRSYLKWILFLLSKKFAFISKGLVYLMQTDTAYCMVKSQLHMSLIVTVALCSVCWEIVFYLVF